MVGLVETVEGGVMQQPVVAVENDLFEKQEGIDLKKMGEETRNFLER